MLIFFIPQSFDPVELLKLIPPMIGIHLVNVKSDQQSDHSVGSAVVSKMSLIWSRALETASVIFAASRSVL